MLGRKGLTELCALSWQYATRIYQIRKNPYLLNGGQSNSDVCPNRVQAQHQHTGFC